MALFEKREVVFRRKDKDGWEKAKKILKEAGVEGVRAGAYESEAPVCGCGSKLDPRDFGPRGKIDRRTFDIRVPVREAERAKALLGNLAIEAENAPKP